MLLRGAIPSPRHRLAAAKPHLMIGTTPESFLRKPFRLSMWLNDVDGDCVTAEEAFAKACHAPEIYITCATVKAWATANNVLNGAVIYDVLEAMQTRGFEQNGKQYNDGKPISVDWTNPALLRNAIFQGPVKIGVAADQLQPFVEGQPGTGWVATGFAPDQNIDHCVSLCGYGTFAWLAQKLSANLPQGVDPSQPGYALFTWSSIGIIDPASMQAITAEAWLRTPTTVLA